MHFYKLTVFNLILLIQLHLSHSLGTNHYGKCNTKKCGNLNITYPFYIPNQQQKYCGLKDFEVICKDNKLPMINLSGDFFLIHNIWYKTLKFKVTNFALLDHNCSYYKPKNLSLPPKRLGFAKDQSIIYVYPNCPKKVLEINKEKRVKCGGIAVYKNDSKVKDLDKECNGEVTFVPYNGGDSHGRIEEDLGNGFILIWNAYDCLDCVNSGGQCGFDEKNTAFNCYCPDRTHALHCTASTSIRLGGGIMFLFLAILAIWQRKKLSFGISKMVTRSASMDRSELDPEKGNLYFGVSLFSYSELLEATDNFNQSKELGDGGFGTVYYGKLKDGREVAIKRLYEKNFRRMEQFMTEIEILTRLRHQNLVSLYGCTSQQSRELLLVYEYVENGTVADHLYGENAKLESLTWPVRLRIAVETASALSYLHASDTIHRDVKTNNILLDSNFRVRVADFGLSRDFPSDMTHISTAPQGTPGYLDPEYHQCYQLTDKSDVYSFGVVLIELISSLPPIDMNRKKHEINLSNYARNRIQCCAFEELVDPQLGFVSDFKVRKMTTLVAELAFQCLQHAREFRPSMDVVLETLKMIESNDYEALQNEDMAKSSEDDMNTQNNISTASPAEDDHPPSLISVVER
ncbi:unnamed protein product [Amaranthus hypochondriacus]